MAFMSEAGVEGNIGLEMNSGAESYIDARHQSPSYPVAASNFGYQQ